MLYFKLTNMKKILIVLGTFFVVFSCGETKEKENKLVKKSNTQSSVFEDSNAVFGSNKSSEDPITNPENISIKLTPFVPQYEGIGDSSSKLLKDRLNNAITKVGYGGEGANPRFIIGPSVNILSSNLTATAPPKYANTYEINFMVVDTQTETVFNSYSTELKGVGDSEEKAFISGARNLKLNTQGFIDFLKQSENKIFKYFEDNCSAILAEANSEAAIRNYDVAFSLLNSIPKESEECFKSVQEQKISFFELNLNTSCAELLNKMRAELGKFNDSSGSGFNAEAMHYYSLIDAKSSCYKDAQKEYNQYVSKLDPVAKRDWNQKLVEYKDEIELVKLGKQFEMEEKKMAFEYQTKIKELESKTEIEGNKRLLAKYKHDESPWLIRLFSSGSKLFKGEMSTSK